MRCFCPCAVLFRASPYAQCFSQGLRLRPVFLAGPRPATRRPLLKKGSIRKLFCGWATYFQWKGKEPGMPEPLFFGCRSMDTGRRPLCGCFVLSCMVGGIFRKPLGFRRCLPPARPEKAMPFQAGRSPCTKHQQTVRLCLYAPKKVFEGSKGAVFQKRTLGRVWDSVPQKEGKPSSGCAFSGGTKSLHETPQIVRHCLHALKKFLRVPRGVFSKTHPWQGVGQRPTKGEGKPVCGVRPFRRDGVP